MPCTDDTRPKQGARWLRSMTGAGWRLRAALAGLAGLGLLGGCGSNAPATDTNPPPAATSRSTSTGGTGGTGTASTATTPTTPAAPTRTAQGTVKLPPPTAMRNWDDVRKQAAQRMVAANPGGTYMGVPPEPLLAIPVLEIELNGDGSVRKVGVLRHPRQAKDTTQIAIEAVKNAGPYGDVSRLPKPWRFTETFLFDDDRRFKPRTLD